MVLMSWNVLISDVWIKDVLVDVDGRGESLGLDICDSNASLRSKCESRLILGSWRALWQFI